jgi:hypothetical protein
MLQPSLWLWNVLPKLQFVQFPWRWLEALSFVFSFLVAAAATVIKSRRACWMLVGSVLLAIAITGVVIVRNAWWDDQDIPVMAQAIRSGSGYEGTDEYMPIGGDRLQLPGNTDDDERPDGVSSAPAPRIEKVEPRSGALVPATGVRLHIDRWSAEDRIVVETSAVPLTLALRLVNYPAWEASIDGRPADPNLRPATSQILLPLPAGEHRIEVRFLRTRDRRAGAGISALSGCTLLALALWLRKQAPAAARAPSPATALPPLERSQQR